MKLSSGDDERISEWSVNSDRTLVAIKYTGGNSRITCWRLDPSGRVVEQAGDWSAGNWRILGWAGKSLLAFWRNNGRQRELQIMDVENAESTPARYDLVGRPLACGLNRTGDLEALLAISDGAQALLCSHSLQSGSYLPVAGTNGLSGVGAWYPEQGIVAVNLSAEEGSPGTVRLYRGDGHGYTDLALHWPRGVIPTLAIGNSHEIVGLTGIDGQGRPVPGLLDLSTQTVRWLTEHIGYSCADISQSGSQVLVVAWSGEEFTYRVLDAFGNQLGELRSLAGIATDMRFSRDGLHVIGWYQSPVVAPDVVRWNWRDGEPRPIRRRTGRTGTSSMRWEFRWVSDVGESKLPEWVFTPITDEHCGVVLFLHGGPRGRLNQAYDPVIEALVSSGWAVVGMNYPGSSGYGFDYREQTRGDWGGADARSVERRVRSLHAEAGDRPVCMYGYSYGAYLALLVAAIVPRLIAGVAVWAPVVDLTSLLDASVGVQRRWLEHELGELRFDARELWERSPVSRLSALSRIRVLVGHGRRDEQCPVEQSRWLVELLGRSAQMEASVRYLEDPAGSHMPSDWRWWTDAVLAHFGQPARRIGACRGA